ncbi:hypothetical protein [Pseudonocardia sp. GCM10023141]
MFTRLQVLARRTHDRLSTISTVHVVGLVAMGSGSPVDPFATS